MFKLSTCQFGINYLFDLGRTPWLTIELCLWLGRWMYGQNSILLLHRLWFWTMMSLEKLWLHFCTVGESEVNFCQPEYCTKKAYTLRLPLSACALHVITHKHFTSSHCSTPPALYYQKRHLEKQASHTGLVNCAIWRNNISELKIWSSKLGPFMGDWLKI